MWCEGCGVRWVQPRFPLLSLQVTEEDLKLLLDFKPPGFEETKVVEVRGGHHWLPARG